jgi:hypothetical protein
MRKPGILLFSVIFFMEVAALPGAAAETARVTSLAGDVGIVPDGMTGKIACRPDMALKAGDRIITGEESHLDIAFDRTRKNTVRIEADSDVRVRLDGEDRVELVDGEIVASLDGLKKGEIFRVRTPCGVCGASDTSWVTSVKENIATVSAVEGKVFVRGINENGSVMEKEYWVEEGFERKVRRFERPEKMSKIPRDRFLNLEKRIAR